LTSSPVELNGDSQT